MDARDLISRDAELMETEVDGDTVALDVDRGTCFGFNPTAARVWALLESPLPFGSLVDRLTDEFDVGRDECARDVGALVADMAEQRLLRVTPAA